MFLEHAFALARSLGIETIVVLASEVARRRLVLTHRETEKIIWLTREESDDPPVSSTDALVRIPAVTVTRMSQLTIGLFLAVLSGELDLDERVLCLSGIAKSNLLDLLLITSPRRDFAWLRKRDLSTISDVGFSRHLGRLLEIALRLSAEGREGRPIGTTLILGDLNRLRPHLRQLILNPCKGHAKAARSIHSPEFFETLREFSALDGALVIDPKGTVEAAGTYLDAPSARIRVKRGLGARHVAAAAVTKATNALAAVLSESSGSITLFHRGRALFEIERPRSG
jgi:DNA integrity scanning protein DisA with diadenylate cyclase activity